MTRQEIEEEYFIDFLKWCAAPPDSKAGDILFWLDYHFPSTDNFWEWVVKYKSGEFETETKGLGYKR